MQYDFLLVGQGLAGSALAMHMLDAQLTFKVVDPENKNTSSKVSAGLFNPITGRNMVKTWNADRLFPYLMEYYTCLEQRFSSKFFFPIGIYRPFWNRGEQNEWLEKAHDDPFKPFIANVLTSSRASDKIKDDFGGLLLQQAGYVETKTYLTAVRRFLVSENLLIHDAVTDISVLKKSPVKYNGDEFKYMVLCDGSSGLSQKMFPFLPFRPVKGDILEIESDLDIDYILNRGVWVIPKGEKNYKLGSTYSHNLEVLTPQGEDAQKILVKVNKLQKLPIKVKEHTVGVRPATSDRKPFIGTHPELNHLYVFNGFGSKGTSLTPYYAKQFTESFLKKSSLDKEVDIRRHFS